MADIFESDFEEPETESEKQKTRDKNRVFSTDVKREMRDPERRVS